MQINCKWCKNQKVLSKKTILFDDIPYEGYECDCGCEYVVEKDGSLGYIPPLDSPVDTTKNIGSWTEQN
jgi:hypothetical protein